MRVHGAVLPPRELAYNVRQEFRQLDNVYLHLSLPLPYRPRRASAAAADIPQAKAYQRRRQQKPPHLTRQHQREYDDAAGDYRRKAAHIAPPAHKLTAFHVCVLSIIRERRSVYAALCSVFILSPSSCAGRSARRAAHTSDSGSARSCHPRRPASRRSPALSNGHSP